MEMVESRKRHIDEIQPQIDPMTDQAQNNSGSDGEPKSKKPRNGVKELSDLGKRVPKPNLHYAEDYEQDKVGVYIPTRYFYNLISFIGDHRLSLDYIQNPTAFE